MLKGTNEQKNFVDKLLFSNRPAQYAFKLLALISLRDVTYYDLVHIKYLIMASHAFLLQNNVFKSTLCSTIVMKKDAVGHALIF